MTDLRSGSCLCGAVTYTVDGPVDKIIYCHCSQCRRQTGLYYATTNCKDEQLKVKGAENITWFQSSQTGLRGFCRHCGSALFGKYAGEDTTSIQAGSFEQPSGLVPGYHIHCADKGDFYEINDGLPQFADGGPARPSGED